MRDIVDVAVMRNNVGGIFNNKPRRADSRYFISDVIVGEDSLRVHENVVFNQVLPRDGLRLLIDIDGDRLLAFGCHREETALLLALSQLILASLARWTD